MMIKLTLMLLNLALSFGIYGSTPFEANEQRIKQERQQSEAEDRKRTEEWQRRELEFKKEVEEREALLSSFREKPYKEAVERAARGKVAIAKLEPITLTNPNLIWNKAGDRLLTVSWIPESPYKRYYEPTLESPGKKLKSAPNFAALSWVTMVPKIKEFAKDYLKTKEIATTPLQVRVAQLVGLPRPLPGEKRYFVEMWVKPKDIVRPCSPDVQKTSGLQCEIIETNPGTELAATPTGKKPGETGYEKWFKEKEEYEYWQSIYYYPWTRKGYTFDWGPGSEKKENIGVEEFIIKPGTEIILKSSDLTDNYPKTATPVSKTIVTA